MSPSRTASEAHVGITSRERKNAMVAASELTYSGWGVAAETMRPKVEYRPGLGSGRRGGRGNREPNLALEMQDVLG